MKQEQGGGGLACGKAALYERVAKCQDVRINRTNPPIKYTTESAFLQIFQVIFCMR